MSTAPVRPLRILILNWRDLRHPRAGGAEVLTHGHAYRLVERGHEVTMFVGAADGAPTEEVLDGVRVVRRGGPVTTRLEAFRWYRRERRAGAHFDVVVEEINTLPYLASRFADRPTVLWMHQLAREVWWYEAPTPLAAVGFALEQLYVRLYRSVPTLVLSPSTRDDLLALGFHADDVVVVPPAIDFPAHPPTSRTDRRLLVYVGRITPSKRVGHLVEALALARARGVDVRLDVVGTGSERERERVLARARALGVARDLRFAGYLSADDKRELLARAALVVMASVREGWGLVVTEANALGTPAVVYDRPGLRDSTVHEETGLVVEPNPASLADGVVRALTEPGVYERLSAGARVWSRRFTWERASWELERALVRAARTPRRRDARTPAASLP